MRHTIATWRQPTCTKTTYEACNTCVETLYLCGNIWVLDVILQVRHEHEVTGLEPAVMQGVVVDLTQDGSRPQAVSGVLGINVLTQLVHHLFRGRLLSYTQWQVLARSIHRLHSLHTQNRVPTSARMHTHTHTYIHKHTQPSLHTKNRMPPPPPQQTAFITNKIQNAHAQTHTHTQILFFITLLVTMDFKLCNKWVGLCLQWLLWPQLWTNKTAKSVRVSKKTLHFPYA